MCSAANREKQDTRQPTEVRRHVRPRRTPTVERPLRSVGPRQHGRDGLVGLEVAACAAKVRNTTVRSGGCDVRWSDSVVGVRMLSVWRACPTEKRAAGLPDYDQSNQQRERAENLHDTSSWHLPMLTPK